MKRNTLLLLALLFAMAGFSQTGYKPAPENLEARTWFQDAKFGLFIHWGVYSVLGNGEWVMNNERMPIKDYEKLPDFFNPVSFDPAAWVALVKAAGMKYICITSKHHDGFAMWDSKVSDYNVVKRTPYGKDVLKMLADECHKQGIKLFFYHSQLDWHNPDFYPRGGTGHYSGRPDAGDWNKYLDYQDAQLRELLTNYGEIGAIWFDGFWDKKNADWRLDKTYQLIHSLQPACMIGNNHHMKPFPGEDFQMFEKDLPGFNTTGFSGESEVSSLPLETCETMSGGGAWGFNIYDQSYKTTEQLIPYLVKAAGYNSNFLLNVGPMPNGKIQPEFVQTLKEIGTWMQANGETIYGTRGGPFPPREWGVSTQKGNNIFVHILKWNDPLLTLAPLGKKIKEAKMYNQQVKVKFSQTKEGVVLTLPTATGNEIDRIVELTVE